MVTAANNCLAALGAGHSSPKNGCRTYEAKVKPMIALVVGLRSKLQFISFHYLIILLEIKNDLYMII